MKSEIQSVSIKITAEDLAKMGVPESRRIVDLTAQITPINDKVSPTFHATSVLKSGNGPELLALVAEIRNLVFPYEKQVFAWLKKSPNNPKRFMVDPVGSLKEMNIDFDKATWDKINRAGELIKASVSHDTSGKR